MCDYEWIEAHAMYTTSNVILWILDTLRHFSTNHLCSSCVGNFDVCMLALLQAHAAQYCQPHMHAVMVHP